MKTMKDKMKQVKKIGMTEGKTLKKSLTIEVGDWVKYTWGRRGADESFTIAVVTEIFPATPQAIEAHPSLKDLVLYNLSNGACLRAEAFVEVRKKS
jgi:hypothetical protein